MVDLLPADFAQKLEDPKYKVFRDYKEALTSRPSWEVRCFRDNAERGDRD